MTTIESYTQDRPVHVDLLAYGTMDGAMAVLRTRTTVHIDKTYPQQSWAKLDLWTMVGWKELVRLLPAEMGALTDVDAVARRLGQRAEAVNGGTL